MYGEGKRAVCPAIVNSGKVWETLGTPWEAASRVHTKCMRMEKGPSLELWETLVKLWDTLAVSIQDVWGGKTGRLPC